MKQTAFVWGAMSALLLASTAQAAGTASLTTTGYLESFDSMGTTGTTPPTGWSVYTGASGTTNTTWTNSTGIPASGVATMTLVTGPLTATSAPTTTNNNGFNAALSPTATADRVLATSPTTTSGGALQLTIRNDTGSLFTDMVVGYDTVRFTSVATANELPGYWLFYSLDGSNWTNVPALNPTLATVPNTVGVTAVSNATVQLSTAVAAGGTLYLRWVDDNANQTSPDQILGLNNVSVSAVTPAVPEVESVAMLAAGLGLLALHARRQRG